MMINRKFNKTALLLISMLVLAACGNEPADVRKDTRFFDLAHFIEQQVNIMDSLQPQIRKRVKIGENQEEKIITETNWQKELELFVQADISKPAIQVSYQVEEAGDQVRIYKAKEGENPNVKYIKAQFDKASGQIVSLEAHISKSNYLYHSEKKIWLQCRLNSQRKSQVASYRIAGTQKLIFNEQVPYQIEAEVLL